MEFLGVFLLVFLLVRSPKHLQARIVPTVDLPLQLAAWRCGQRGYGHRCERLTYLYPFALYYCTQLSAPLHFSICRSLNTQPTLDVRCGRCRLSSALPDCLEFQAGLRAAMSRQSPPTF